MRMVYVAGPMKETFSSYDPSKLSWGKPISKEIVMRLYQIFDRVSGEVTGLIMSYRIDAPAIRTFHDWLQNPKTGPGAHAGDFDLLFLGEQDSLGVITPVIPTAVALGASWLASVTSTSEDK